MSGQILFLYAMEKLEYIAIYLLEYVLLQSYLTEGLTWLIKAINNVENLIVLAGGSLDTCIDLAFLSIRLLGIQLHFH